MWIVLDLLFLTRPTILVPVWTFMFLGYFWASGHRFLQIQLVPQKAFWMVFASYTFLMAGSYIVNQISDRETDRLNRKLFLLSEGKVPVYLAYIWLFLLWGVSLYLLLKIGGVFGILWPISLLMGLLYSLPPVKFKGRPFFDLIFNSIGYGMVNFLVGWITVSPIDRWAFVHSIPYVLLVGAVFLNTTVPDIPGDRLSGEITTGVYLGEKSTTLFALAMITPAIILAVVLKDPFSLIASLFSFPFFLKAFLNPNDLNVKLSYRIGGATLVLMVSLRYILFFAVLIFLFVALKFYYKFRFGLDYPTLKGR